MEDETVTPDETQDSSAQPNTNIAVEAPDVPHTASTDLGQVLALLGSLKQARLSPSTDAEEDADDDIPILTEVYGVEGNIVIDEPTTTSLQSDTPAEIGLTRDEIVTLLQEVLAPLIEQEVKKVVQQELAVSEKILSKAIAKRFRDAMKANGLSEKNET